MADTATAVAVATPDLEVIEGHVTTTSNQIAAHFGKRHDTVLRAIRNLLAELPEDYRRNFAEVKTEFTNGKGGVQQATAYRITRDGFTLLAMGFTGKEAMQWKVAYLAAFNKMEAELLARTTRPANPAIDVTDAPAMAAARRVALDYFSAYRTSVKEGKPGPSMDAIPVEALQGLIADAVMRQRMLVSFSPDSGCMHSRLIPGDAAVVSFSKDDYFSLVQHIPMARIPEMLDALNKRVASHLGALDDYLKRGRTKALPA